MRETNLFSFFPLSASYFPTMHCLWKVYYIFLQENTQVTKCFIFSNLTWQWSYLWCHTGKMADLKNVPLHEVDWNKSWIHLYELSWCTYFHLHLLHNSDPIKWRYFLLLSTRWFPQADTRSTLYYWMRMPVSYTVEHNRPLFSHIWNIYKLLTMFFFPKNIGNVPHRRQ